MASPNLPLNIDLFHSDGICMSKFSTWNMYISKDTVERLFLYFKALFIPLKFVKVKNSENYFIEILNLITWFPKVSKI